MSSVPTVENVVDLKTQWESALKELKQLCKTQSDQLKQARADVDKWGQQLNQRERPRSGLNSGFLSLHDVAYENCKTFELKASKNWNIALQELLEKHPRPAAECLTKQRVIEDLTKEFHAEMAPKVQELIQSLQDPARSPVNVRPTNCAEDSVVATVLENPLDIKRATRELLAHHVVQQCLEGVGYPLFTVVQYLGYTVTLCAVTPTSNASAVFGYRRHRVHLKSPHLEHALRRCCEYLNLCGYSVADNIKDTMYGGCELEGHIGKDGLYYVGHAASLFPHFPPPRGQPLNKENTVLLRPEFVQRYSEPLSPGAFFFHGTSDSRKNNTAVRNATAHLCQNIAPLLAADLAANPATSNDDLVCRVHASGVNIALLGIVLHHVPDAAAETRAMIITELVSRACRSLLWHQMRVDAGGDEDEARSCISNFVCSLCDPTSLPTLWKDIERKMKDKYIAFNPAKLAHTSIDVDAVFKRLGQLCGFRFSPGVTSKGSSPFHFSVENISVKLKSVPKWGYHICPEGFKKYRDPTTSVDETEQAFRDVISRYQDEGTLTPVRALHLYTALVRCLWYTADDKLRFPSLTKAESYCKRVVTQREKVDGGDSYMYTDELMMLATFYSTVKSFSPAMSVLQKVVSIRQRILGDSLETAVAMYALAQGYVGNRMHTEALSSMEDALKMLVHTVGELHPKVMLTLNSIAELYEDRGQYEDAETYHEQLLDITKDFYGANHLKVTTVLNNLAVNYYHQEKYEEAEELYKEDLRITEQFFGSHHPSMASTLNNLACLYDLQEKYEEAEPLYIQDIEITVQSNGTENHPDVATSYNNLAASYAKRRRFAEAEQTYRKSLAIRQELYRNQDHVDVADSLNNLGALYRMQGNLVPAKQYFEQALAVYKKTLGNDHHLLRKCLENLQSVCEEMDDMEEADQYTEHILELERGDQLASYNPVTRNAAERRASEQE